LRHDFVALAAVGLLDGLLDAAAMASSRGSTPEMAKKQVCMNGVDAPAHAGVAGDLGRRR
jgi:hypothetical protein